jgi:HEXXH motif-containing protein
MNSGEAFEVRSFSGGGNLLLTRSLLQARQRMNGLELLAIARHLKDTGRHPLFQPFLDDLRAVPPADFWQVWTSPAAYLWTRLAWQGLQYPRQPSDLVERHAAWLAKRFEQFLSDHLKQVGLFTVAAHLHMGDAYRAPALVPLDATGSFPSAGVGWRAPRPFALRGCTAAGEVLAHLEGGEIAYGVLSEPGADSPFFRVPAAIGRGALWVDAWDTCSRLDYAGMEWTPRVTEYPAVRDAARRVTGALARIEAYSPCIAEEIGHILSVATPLRAVSEHSSHSGSVSFIPGAFAFADLNDEDRLAEMILHELSHNKLFLLDDRDPLLDQTWHGDGWRDECYYSPWRDDPRPLKGILHGVFVFVEVASFWANRLPKASCLPSDAVSVRRFKTVFAQLEVACEVLEGSAHFTPIGARLFDELRNRLASLRNLAEGIDGRVISPLYAELQKDGRYGGLSLDEAICRHRRVFSRRSEVRAP